MAQGDVSSGENPHQLPVQTRHRPGSREPGARRSGSVARRSGSVARGGQDLHNIVLTTVTTVWPTATTPNGGLQAFVLGENLRRGTGGRECQVEVMHHSKLRVSRGEDNRCRGRFRLRTGGGRHKATRRVFAPVMCTR